MEKYQRGDLVDKPINREMSDKEIAARGNAIEDMINQDGWKYFKDWIEDQVDFTVNMLTNIKVVDIDKINDLRCIIQTYKGLLRKPKEFMEQRNNKEE